MISPGFYNEWRSQVTEHYGNERGDAVGCHSYHGPKEDSANRFKETRPRAPEAILLLTDGRKTQLSFK